MWESIGMLDGHPTMRVFVDWAQENVTEQILYPYPWVVFKNFLYRLYYWALRTYIDATHLKSA